MKRLAGGVGAVVMSPEDEPDNIVFQVVLEEVEA